MQKNGPRRLGLARLKTRATCFISPSDTLKASLNALTSSLVMTPSALAIFALRAITPTVKGSSLSADRSRGSRSTWAAPPNSVPIEAPTDDSATAHASLSQMDIEILPNYRLMQSIYHEAKLRRPSLKQIKPDSPVSWGIIQSEYFYARACPIHLRGTHLPQCQMQTLARF